MVREVQRTASKVKPVTRTRKVREEVAEEVVVTRKVRTPRKEAEAPAALFNPLLGIDDQLDAIEKDYTLSGSSMDPDELRQPTGLLTIDLILGKGLVPGWYTFFGPEQSCKSTGASTFMGAALNSGIPVISYWDFEGCLIGNTKIAVNGVETTIGWLFEGRELKAGEDIPIDSTLEVETAEGRALIESIRYHGDEETTSVEVSTGQCLTGFRHPILALTSEGTLEMKYLEDLKVGDQVVVRA